MVIVKFEVKHFGATARALERVIAETEEDRIAPFVEGKEETLLFF